MTFQPLSATAICALVRGLNEADQRDVAHDLAWRDHQELEQLSAEHTRAWQNQDAATEIRCIARRREIMGQTMPCRPFDRRSNFQKDHDEYVEEMSLGGERFGADRI